MTHCFSMDKFNYKLQSNWFFHSIFLSKYLKSFVDYNVITMLQGQSNNYAQNTNSLLFLREAPFQLGTLSWVLLRPGTVGPDSCVIPWATLISVLGSLISICMDRDVRNSLSQCDPVFQLGSWPRLPSTPEVQCALWAITQLLHYFSSIPTIFTSFVFLPGL